MGDSARAKSSSKLDQRLWPITGLSGGLLLLPVGAEGASIALALISEATCCARLLERRAERPVRTTERGESKRDERNNSRPNRRCDRRHVKRRTKSVSAVFQFTFLNTIRQSVCGGRRA